jgi:branched-chain amino acid transport system substrate-binding protein
MRKIWLAVLAALALTAPMLAAAQPKEVFIPLLVYRTGPYAPSGIPIADGFVDYFTLLNERDGGINGVKLAWEECETQYDNKQGVECYERLKGKGPVLVTPYSTAITYSLIPKAPVDKIVAFSMGYGMSAASDGRWFPWVFNFPTNYWSQASAVIRYIGQQEGGLEKLKGKKIAHIFHNSAYGKEANPTLEELSKSTSSTRCSRWTIPGGSRRRPGSGAATEPGLDLHVGLGRHEPGRHRNRVGRPDGPLIGNWWSANDSDVVPAGGAPRGTGRHASCPGTSFKVHADLMKFVYDKGKGSAKKEDLGAPLYNRGLVNAMLAAEAIRTAMTKYGNKPLTGEQGRWGFENLNLTEQRLDQVGMKSFTHPVKVTCEDHEGSGPVLIQQWDGKKWTVVSDWIAPMRDVVRPKIEAAAIEEGKKLGYTIRDCSKEN